MLKSGAFLLELDPMHETFREYERVVDARYLGEIRAQAKQFSTQISELDYSSAELAISTIYAVTAPIFVRSAS